VDGTVPFYRPTGKGSVNDSCTLDAAHKLKDVGFYAEVQSLATCRRQLHTRWVDILKVDAEGVELEVCESRPFLRPWGK